MDPGIGAIKKKPEQLQKKGNGLLPSVTVSRYPLNKYAAPSRILHRCAYSLDQKQMELAQTVPREKAVAIIFVAPVVSRAMLQDFRQQDRCSLLARRRVMSVYRM
jgi:hypothetical protein